MPVIVNFVRYTMLLLMFESTGTRYQILKTNCTFILTPNIFYR